MNTALRSNSSTMAYPLQQWHRATWQEYIVVRDKSFGSAHRQPEPERTQLFFDQRLDQGWLWIDMGSEGINHATISDLFTMLFFIWSTQNPGITISSLGRCLLEKSPIKAGAPDLVVYTGDPYPRWQPGEPRRIDLHQWPLPSLVGEISDTTLATDLDEKKQIYAALGIPEYWVIDVQGQRVFVFHLHGSVYQQATKSQVLTGVTTSLLGDALRRLNQEANTQVATWLASQLQQT